MHIAFFPETGTCCSWYQTENPQAGILAVHIYIYVAASEEKPQYT